MVIKTALKAQKMGLVVLTFGNFSLRDKQTGYICITPSGMDYQELQPEDIVVVDLNGKIIDGKRRPSVERQLHSYIYQLRADVCGVCHTHSTFASAWAASDEPLPVIIAELAHLVGEHLDTAPYRPIGSSELAAVTGAALADKAAVLMANHGLVAVGADLKEAFNNAVLVEECAKITAYAKNIGALRSISAEECRDIKEAANKYGQEKSKN